MGFPLHPGVRPSAGTIVLSDDTDTEFEAETATLPLDAWHRGKGARMVEFAGYWMPIQYDGPDNGIIAEHQWTREHAGLFDVSHMGQLLLSGPDLDAAVETVLPIDLSTLKLACSATRCARRQRRILDD